jgi:hypothetical protein
LSEGVEIASVSGKEVIASETQDLSFSLSVDVYQTTFNRKPTVYQSNRSRVMKKSLLAAATILAGQYCAAAGISTGAFASQAALAASSSQTRSYCQAAANTAAQRNVADSTQQTPFINKEQAAAQAEARAPDVSIRTASAGLSAAMFDTGSMSAVSRNPAAGTAEGQSRIRSRQAQAAYANAAAFQVANAA